MPLRSSNYKQHQYNLIGKMEKQGNLQEQQWIVVTNKKHRSSNSTFLTSKKKPKKIWSIGSTPYNTQNQAYDVQQLQSSQNIMDNLRMAEYMIDWAIGEKKVGFAKVRWSLDGLGIGDFLKCSKPRVQYNFGVYGLLPLLNDKFGKGLGQCEYVKFYDPIFGEEHKKKLSQDIPGWTYSQDIEFKKPQQIRQTCQDIILKVFFMPHCERFLYQNVLNLLAQALQTYSQPQCKIITIIIGNSIYEYQQRCRMSNTDIPRQFLKFKFLEKKFKDHKEAFNDTYVYCVI